MNEDPFVGAIINRPPSPQNHGRLITAPTKQMTKKIGSANRRPCETTYIRRVNATMERLHERKPNRLKDYDYSRNGLYFITICVKDKHEMLGKICVGAIINRPHDSPINRPHDSPINRPHDSPINRPHDSPLNRPHDSPLNRPQGNPPQNPLSQSNLAQVCLSEYGSVVERAIQGISEHYPQAEVKKYVIMPNHVHLILLLKDNGSTSSDGRLIIAPTQVSTIVQQLKRSVSKDIGFSFWQRSFHDHIIRGKADYRRICQYIRENPSQWHKDCYYVEKTQ
jgi:REP element-mobilizing transposase RayT